MVKIIICQSLLFCNSIYCIKAKEKNTCISANILEKNKVAKQAKRFTLWQYPNRLYRYTGKASGL